MSIVRRPMSDVQYETDGVYCQQLGILKIYNGYRYRIGTGTENFSFLWWYRNRYRKNLVPEKSLRTGIGQIWYRKKVSEPVSGKFGTVKSIGIGNENILYQKKVSVSVSFDILGAVTHWSRIKEKTKKNN